MSISHVTNMDQAREFFDSSIELNSSRFKVLLSEDVIAIYDRTVDDTKQPRIQIQGGEAVFKRYDDLLFTIAKKITVLEPVIFKEISEREVSFACHTIIEYTARDSSAEFQETTVLFFNADNRIEKIHSIVKRDMCIPK